LSLEQEYEMQQSWRDSDDKCTFIILHKSTFETADHDDGEVKAMIGDTNIFIRTEDEALIGEAEIMIAETSFRGQKLGWESMNLMLLYGIEKLKIKQFEAKIKLDNSPSIAMFQKFQFNEESRSEVFQEMTLTVQVTDEWITFLQNQVKNQRSLDDYQH
jgi:RimJ/RimL family protein N-acetyltransferase